MDLSTIQAAALHTEDEISHRSFARVACGQKTPGSLLATAATMALAMFALCSPHTAAAQDVRIEHVSVVSPERPGILRDAEVDISNGQIESISKGKAPHPVPEGASSTRTINARGLYLTPGLIDSHVHLGMIPGMTAEQEAEHPELARAARDQMPRSFLLFGFTTLVDLISTPSAMVRWKHQDPVPDTYFCGGAALMDGYPMNQGPKPARYQVFPYMLIEPGTQAPAGIDRSQHTPAAVVRRMKADGAICVKTFFERGFGGIHNLPVPQAQTIRALVREAHARGLPVLMHANSDEAQSFALDTGVDIIAHGLWNTSERPARPEALTPSMKLILDRVIGNKVGWQPTIQVLYGLQDLFNPEFLSDPMLAKVLPHDLINWYGTPEGQWFHNEVAAGAQRVDFSRPIGRVKAATNYLAGHGGGLLFGTDTPSAPSYANPPGLNAWKEMQDLIDAGVTPAQIFEMATLSNARALKLDREIGTVQVGKRANLLLLRQDPRQSIHAYTEVVKVILGGRMLDPKDLAVH